MLNVWRIGESALPCLRNRITIFFLPCVTYAKVSWIKKAIATMRCAHKSKLFESVVEKDEFSHFCKGLFIWITIYDYVMFSETHERCRTSDLIKISVPATTPRNTRCQPTESNYKSMFANHGFWRKGILLLCK